MYRTRTRTRDMVIAALFAALLCASAYVAIPLQPVPVTLQMFVVILAALLLEPVWAAAAVGTYVLLGATGVPVFAGARGGLGVLFGPTGGYLFGFLAGAWAGAIVRKSVDAAGAREVAAQATAAAVALVTVYLIGWAQLALVTQMGPVSAFVAGVLPFAALDALKAVAAVGVAAALRRAGVPALA